MTEAFPPLPLETWRETRDALHSCCRVLGRIRATLSPPHKHWWHVTLHPSVNGLSTGLVPAPGAALELTLDLAAQRLVVAGVDGRGGWLPLEGQTAAEFLAGTLALLDGVGVRPSVDPGPLRAGTPWSYEPVAARRYLRALTDVHLVFAAVRSSWRQESSPIQLFPHHFDLALTWFSGRRVPGEDADDPEAADEQMTFGFVTGDESFPEAYFYAIAYPSPEGLLDGPLPSGAFWHDEGFTGGVLPYREVAGRSGGGERLAAFLRAAHAHGARRLGEASS